MHLLLEFVTAYAVGAEFEEDLRLDADCFDLFQCGDGQIRTCH